ncbi:uncharacterized protein LOC133226085 [Neopsephotus bourkii]|uniref:uncharacterized protein LOC133226085 n=1 Tax=Neopsephotus bourkii TaxID=309878 RepID=UPI002AA55178|nr:uncharacterized protein LOC133226085 [Neopsephotus bourkii]
MKEKELSTEDLLVETGCCVAALLTLQLYLQLTSCLSYRAPDLKVFPTAWAPDLKVFPTPWAPNLKVFPTAWVDLVTQVAATVVDKGSPMTAIRATRVDHTPYKPMMVAKVDHHPHKVMVATRVDPTRKAIRVAKVDQTPIMIIRVRPPIVPMFRAASINNCLLAPLQRSGCAKKKVLVARDTSHVLSKRAYDSQNESSTSNSSHSNPQGGCVCPDGSSGSRQGAPGSSHSTYSGNQGGPSFYPGGSYGQDGQGSSYGSYSGNQGGSSFYHGGSYGQGAPGSSHSTYSGNQGGPSFYPGRSYGQDGQDSSYSSYSGNQGGSSFSPGGSYGQGGSSAYDSTGESYGQGGSSTYSGAGSYGQDSSSIGGSDSDNGSSSLSGSQQNERVSTPSLHVARVYAPGPGNSQPPKLQLVWKLPQQLPVWDRKVPQAQRE